MKTSKNGGITTNLKQHIISHLDRQNVNMCFSVFFQQGAKACIGRTVSPNYPTTPPDIFLVVEVSFFSLTGLVCVCVCVCAALHGAFQGDHFHWSGCSAAGHGPPGGGRCWKLPLINTYSIHKPTWRQQRGITRSNQETRAPHLSPASQPTACLHNPLLRHGLLLTSKVSENI